MIGNYIINNIAQSFCASDRKDATMIRLVSSAAIAALLTTQAISGELTPGKPYDGTELRVLSVRAPQFDGHIARLPEFEEETGIKVAYDFVPFANMREALAAEMVSGQGGYDVVSVMDQWVPSMSLLMDPITDGVETHKIDLTDYPEAFLSAGMIDGELSGLPVRSHVQILFYRKDLFEKHGLSAPKTWAELVETSKKLTEAENVAGIALPYTKLNGQNLMIWYNMLWQAGGKLFDEDGGPAFNSEAGVKSMTDYIGFLNSDKIVPEGSASFHEQDAVNSFKQGKSAMVPIWWWARPTLTNPEQSDLKDEQIGFAALPTYEGAAPTTYTNTWVYGPTEGSQNKDAAMEFLSWVTDPALEKSVLLDPEHADIVSVHYSNLKDPEVNKRWGGIHSTAATALNTAAPVTYNEQWPQVVEILETAVSELASGTKSDVKAVLDDAAERVRDIR